MPDWGSLFSTTVPVVELILRGGGIFLAILVLMRLTGQRESGGLGLTDVLLVVLVAEAAAPGLHGEAVSITDSIVMVITILVLDIGVDAAAYRWPALGRLLKSQPKLLIRDGRTNRKVMRRELITHDEIESILRLQGIEDIRTVKRANLEPNGMVSVLREDGKESDAPEPPAAMA